MFFDNLLTLSGKCFLVEFLGLFVVGNFTAKKIYEIVVKKRGMVVVGWGRGLLIYKRGALIYHEEEGQVRSKTEQIE